MHRVDSYVVELAPEAEARLARLSGLRRESLKRCLRDLAGLAATRQDPPTLGVGTKWDLAACELRHQARVVYVRAVVTRREALEGLVGEEIYGRWRHRLRSRLHHGRWY